MDNERLILEAKSWAINAQWRTVKHRYGVRGKGFVRVARMPPEECMEQLLAYLTSEDGAKGMFLDGKPLTDEWLPLTAWYERVQAPNRTETVEVYQALRHISDAEADGPYVVHDGCTYRESHTFYWGVANLPELPEDSSGISHTLEGVRRDEESGLYSCILVKRERVQVNVAAYLSHKDQMQTAHRAEMHGVRDDESGTVDQKVIAYGTQQGMSPNDGGSNGVTVDVQRSKNEDCTTDVVLIRSTERPVASADVTERVDAFHSVTRITKKAQPSAGAAPVYSAGSVKTVTNTKTPGGRYDVTTEIDTAKSAPNAAKSEQQTISEKRTSKTDRNQAALPGKMSDASGGSRTETLARQNPDGTYDVETTTIIEQPVSGAVKTRTVDKFHTVTRTESLNQAAPVTDPEHVDGEVKRTSNTMTPGGYINTVEEVTTAKTVSKAEEVKQKTFYLNKTTQVDRNVFTAEGEASASQGKIVSKRSSMNNDGTYDVTTDTTEEKAVAAAEKTETETAFAKTVRTVNRAQSAKLNTQRANGTTLRKSYARTDGGMYDTTEEVTTAKTVTDAEVVADNNAFRFVKTTRDRNLTSTGMDAEASDSGAKRTERRMNDDGTTDFTETEITEKQVEAETERNIGHLETRERKQTRGLTLVPPNANELKEGVVTRQVVSLSETGKFQEDLTTVTAHPKSFIVTLAKDPSGTIRRVISFRNYTLAQAQGILAVCHSGSASPNEFGLYDGSGTEITYQDGGRKVQARRDIKEYAETSTTGDIRIVSANGKTYKVTENITYKVGIMHDSSGDRPYREVDGCLHPDVKNLGDGYWQYYGITKKTITWESTTDSETITHSWEA